MRKLRIMAREHFLEDEFSRIEVQRNSRDLRSMTGGRGSHRFEFDHHEQVPRNIAQRVRHREAG